MNVNRTDRRRLQLRRWGVIGLLALLGTSCGDDAAVPDDAIELSPNDVHVANATARPFGDGDAELSLVLYSSVGDRLVFAEVEPSVAAGVAFVDGSAADGGTVIDTIEVRAGSDESLTPGRPHVVLNDVGPDFKPGSSFEMTFNFESSQPRTIDVEVVEN